MALVAAEVAGCSLKGGAAAVRTRVCVLSLFTIPLHAAAQPLPKQRRRAFTEISISCPGPVIVGLSCLLPPGLPPKIKTKEGDKRNGTRKGTPERKERKERGKKRDKGKIKRGIQPRAGPAHPPLPSFRCLPPPPPGGLSSPYIRPWCLVGIQRPPLLLSHPMAT